MLECDRQNVTVYWRRWFRLSPPLL